MQNVPSTQPGFGFSNNLPSTQPGFDFSGREADQLSEWVRSASGLDTLRRADKTFAATDAALREAEQLSVSRETDATLRKAEELTVSKATEDARAALRNAMPRHP